MDENSANESGGPSVLPSVDEVLGREVSVDLIAELGRERVVQMVRRLIAEKRSELLNGGAAYREPVTRENLIDSISGGLSALADAQRRSGVRRVINATGVVVHTNLGRASLSETAVRAMADAAGYASIEYDIEKGSRGKRGARAVSLIRQLTGAEDAIVVNNCAAAAMFILSVFARGREVIVSRGELVEIGGDFRIPDILARSGAVLREVGTTNRTHLRDYEKAVGERTAMILKVHPSNFRISGFTKAQEAADLVELAQRCNILYYEDAGSGALLDLTEYGVAGEPVIGDVVAAGADLVSFSGDKLLGGPQCGIIVGRAELVERLRRDPFYRALRVDKTITAALEATLESFVRGSAKEDIPVLRMLAASSGHIAERSKRFVERLADRSTEDSGLQIELRQSRSAVGGGASPGSAPPTTVIALSHSQLTDAEIERRLRLSDPPIITRIEAGKVLIDLRTVREDEEAEVAAVVEVF